MYLHAYLCSVLIIENLHANDFSSILNEIMSFRCQFIHIGNLFHTNFNRDMRMVLYYYTIYTIQSYEWVTFLFLLFFFFFKAPTSN